MPTDKAKKPTTKTPAAKKPAVKATAVKASAPKTEPVAPVVVEDQPERQSQFATILIGLLIIASGLLIYNYFQSVNQPKTTSQQAQKASPTPTPVFTKDTTVAHYTVVAGDSLWVIAENVYGDGFRWREIAEANNLPVDAAGRPTVTVGQVLVVPDSAASTSNTADSGSSNGDTVASNATPTPTATPKPTTTTTPSPTTTPTPTTGVAGESTTNSQNSTTKAATYTVKHGDSLWSIAEAHYGDGNKWVLIYNDSHNHIGQLANGRPLIHTGNILYLPAP